MKVLPSTLRSSIKFLSVLVAIFIICMTLWQIGVVQAQTPSYQAALNTSFSDISIPAGSTTTLSVSIYNSNSFALTLSTSPAAWVDTLPAGLSFASPANISTNCGGTVTMVGKTLSLLGGSVPAKVGSTLGSCTVTVSVTSIVAGNHANDLAAGTLVATDPTGEFTVSNLTPSSAGLQVDTVQPPTLSKAFASNTIWVGQATNLTITIRNTDTATVLTQVSLTDNLPTNVTVASAPAVSQCGGTVTSTSTSVTLTGGSVPKQVGANPGSCTVVVSVVSANAGVYNNNIPANSIQTRQGVTNAGAAAAPLNVQAIGITKAFSPANFQVGGSSVLTITIKNPSSSPYTGVIFTDTLPAGLTVASAPASPQCNGGIVTYTGSSIHLAGGTVPAGSIGTPGNCTVQLTVTSAIAASYTNSIPVGALTTTQLVTNVIVGSANISVYSAGMGITGSKSFNPTAIEVGGSTLLNIRVNAPADTSLTGFTIFDSLPPNVVIKSLGTTPTAGCGAGSVLSAATGATSISLSNGTVVAGGNCQINVNVTSSVPGSYTNTISPANITNTSNRGLAANFSNTFTVSGLSVSQAFYPTRVNTNGISRLTITLTNANTAQLDGVSLISDTLQAGIKIADTSNATTTCIGGSVTADSLTQIIELRNGIIPAQVGAVAGICTIDVDVKGTGAPNSYTSTIPVAAVTGTIHNTSSVVSNLSQSQVSLTIGTVLINVIKGFSPDVVNGGSSSVLTVRLTNPNNTALTGIKFTDNLPQGSNGGVKVANPPRASVGTCGGTLVANAGDTSFSFNGGSLGANSFCEITLSTVMNVNDTLINVIPIGAVTTSSMASNSQEAPATLANLPGASVSKAFSPNPIFGGVGSTSVLTITIQNLGSAQLNGLGLIDDLPAGLFIADDPAPLPVNNCGGDLTAISGTQRIQLVGGQLAGIENDTDPVVTCTLVVSVTGAPETGLTAGEYQNCLPIGALVNTDNVSNKESTCDTLTVISPPSISKAFAASPIAADVSTGLTFTLTNPAVNTVPLTGVAFTDTFPAGMTVANVPNPSQCGGTVSSTATSITLTGATIPVNSTCTVTASVKASPGGVYNNTSGAVTSTNGGSGNTASASITIISPPVISKLFAPNPIAVGGTSVLTFTITNPVENTVALSGVAFSDTFPAGLTLASAPAVSQCNGTVSSTANSISLTGGSLPVNSSCFVVVAVTAGGGSYPNTSGNVSSTNGGTGLTASNTLSVLGAGLSLDKTTTSSGFQAAGNTITYNYKLTNTGDVTLYPPFRVRDNRIGSPAGTAFDCGSAASLAPLSEDPLANITCTANYTVQASDVTAKSVTNTATASAMDAETDGQVVNSNQDSVTLQLEALTLKKSTLTTGYRIVGNQIVYDYTLTNSGSVNLYPPFEVSDDHIGSPLGTAFTCGTAVSLAPGANLTCTKNYTVVAADLLAPGYVLNTATGYARNVTNNPVVSPTSSVTVYMIIAPQISKSFLPNPVPAGTASTLTFTITNPASNVVPLTGIGFSDTFPAGMTVALAPDAAQCGGTVTGVIDSNQVSFSGGTVLANSSCTVVVRVIVPTRGSYLNTSGNVTSTNGGNGVVPATSTLVVVAPPTISKGFSPTSVLVGGTSTITFTISNSDPTTTLHGVGFTDNYPAGLVTTSAPTASQCGGGTVSSTANSVTLTGGSIGPNSSCTVNVEVTGTSIGTKNNTTNPVTSTEGGTGATSNTATITVDQPILILAKSITAGNPYSVLGGTIQYNYVLTNTGNVTLIGNGTAGLFTVTDNRATVTCPATPTGLEPGASITCTASHTVTQADLDLGNVTNNATAHGLFGVTPIDSNQDSEIATATQSPALTLTKTISSGGLYSAAGNIVHYDYVIRNTGNVTINGAGTDDIFTVDDNKTTVTCPASPTSLAPNATITCTSSYTITQSDLDIKSVTNVARAHARFGSNPLDSNLSTRTASGEPTPVLKLEKSITAGNPYTAVDDEVSFSYLLTNDGNVTLRGEGAGGIFTITDDKTVVTCPATPVSLAPNETVTCTSTYSITQADMDNESVTNSATATAKEPDNDRVTSIEDQATADVMRGSIVGVVYKDVDINQSREITELGIGGVTVRLYDSTGTTLLGTTTTAADGSYSFTNLLPRTFRVVETDPTGYISSTPNTLSVHVNPGGTAEADYGEYQLSTGTTSSITGLVYEDLNSDGIKDPTEQVIPNVTVTLLNQSGGVVGNTLTGTDGRYLFSNLAAGTYMVLETNLAGYQSTTLDHVGVVLSSGSTAEVDYGDLVSEAEIIDPAVTKFGNPTSARIGDRVVYTITVGNNADTDALNVVLTDTKPAFLDIVQITVSPDEGFPVNILDNSFTINFGTVQPTDFFTVTVLTEVNEFGSPPGGENLASLTTTSAPDLVSNNSASANLLITAPYKREKDELPRTGFAPGLISRTPERPAGTNDAATGLTIEIPVLGIKTSIVGLEKSGTTWDVTWLGNQLGYLDGTAYPTWPGNTVITGHVYGADGLPGPFVNLEKLKWGDQLVLHSYGQDFTYEIRSVTNVDPQDTSAFAHKDKSWITLVTCKDYDPATKSYLMRTIAQAVLIKITNNSE